MRFYLYRHIRLDKNEPFYIGIGTKYNDNSKTYEGEYARAFATHSRNKHWRHIVDLTDYRIEIMFESDDYNFAKEREIEFISLYGREDLNTGCLANLTGGGDGSLNTRGYNTKPILQYSIEGKLIKEWLSASEAARFLNIHRTQITAVCKERHNSASGFVWKYKTETTKNSINKVKNRVWKKVLKYDLEENLLGEYKNFNQAAKSINGDRGTIRKVCIGNQLSTKGYKFKYK